MRVTSMVTLAGTAPRKRSHMEDTPSTDKHYMFCAGVNPEVHKSNCLVIDSGATGHIVKYISNCPLEFTI